MLIQCFDLLFDLRKMVIEGLECSNMLAVETQSPTAAQYLATSFSLYHLGF